MKSFLTLTLVAACLFSHTSASLAGISYVLLHDGDKKCLEDFIVSDCTTPAWGLFKDRCETCDSSVEAEGIVYNTTVNCDELRLVTTAWKNQTMVMNATCHDGSCWITLEKDHPNVEDFDHCYNLHTSNANHTFKIGTLVLCLVGTLMMNTLA